MSDEFVMLEVAVPAALYRRLELVVETIGLVEHLSDVPSLMVQAADEYASGFGEEVVSFVAKSILDEGSPETGDEASDDTDGDEYDMVMPFVVCDDNGGPYDHTAYVAGWEMGEIAARLKAAKHHGLGLPELTIHRANLPQLDLVAMEIGAKVVEQEWPDHLGDETREAWARVSLRWEGQGGEG